MLNGFVIGWVCSIWWTVLLVPIYLLKLSFSMVD